MRNLRQYSKGFTLIEMAIVIMIIGVAIAGMTPLYTLYKKNQQIETTTTNVNAAISAIGNFRTLHGRYPCPASLTQDRTNVNYGREDCSDHTATPVGNCTNGICVEQSVRPALAYEYPWGTAHTQRPRVLVGFIPFRHLNLDENQAYDGYMDRIMYVVTEHLTCDNCFQPDQGGINVVNDSGDTALSAAGTAHFVVFSYGENNNGAYTKGGTQLACAGAGFERENCDYNLSAVDADATYQIARGSTANNVNAYDDVVNYFTQDELPLWQMSTAQQQAIHQKAIGDVAVYMDPDVVSEKADVTGTVRVTPDPDDPGSGQYLVQSQLCDMSDDDCFAPSLISGAYVDGTVEKRTGGMKCPEDDTTGGTGPFMVAIEDGRPVCANDVEAECPDDSLLTGVEPDGSLRCNNPPPLNCPSQVVNLCATGDVTLPPKNHGQTYVGHAGANRQRTYRCNDGIWSTVPGSTSGSCDCTPSVNITNGACGYGFTGTQVTTTTRVCPAGTTTTTVNTAACVCDPLTENGTRSCPPGHTGTILTQRNHVCPANTWTGWTDIVGGNSCACADSVEPRTLSCASNYTGTGIHQERTRTCTTTGVTLGAWNTISTDCTCTPTTVQQPFPCATGFTGSIMKEKTLSCPGGTWSGWTNVTGGNTCVAIPPVVCNWNSSTSAQGPYSFTKGVSMEDPCDCGQHEECYARVGTGAYMHYSLCTCE